jgi:hypothetical protein
LTEFGGDQNLVAAAPDDLDLFVVRGHISRKPGFYLAELGLRHLV